MKYLGVCCLNGMFLDDRLSANTYIMETTTPLKNPNTGVRWAVLFTILLNVAFSYLYMYLPGVKTMKEVSDQYNSLFTPAPYTFSIWGLIYFSFVVYGIAQLMPSEKSKWIYDRLAGPVIFIQLMGIAWVTAFSYEYMTTSYGIILFMLGAGTVAFGRAKNAMINPAYSRWLTVPFSLFLGWISAAFIANTAIYLLYRGFDVTFPETINYAAAMIAIAFWLAVVVSLVFRDWIFPMVMAWALYGISQATAIDMVQLLAETSAFALALWSVGYGIYRSARIRQFFEGYKHLHAHKHV